MNMNKIEELEKKANAIRQQIEKLDEQIKLEEAVVYFDEKAKNCPTSKAGCSPSQTNFSQGVWR
tara:strand:+ start:1216 stop:1407 length:192 start_codon:yes stop_codon:yes gene_type:complete